MSKDFTQSRQSIAEEAAEWFVDFREAPPSRRVKERFTVWLTESPVHVEEYLAIARVFGELTHIDPRSEIDPEVLVDDTIVALHGDVTAVAQTGPTVRHRRWLKLGVAASALLAVIAVSVFYTAFQNQALRFETALGEQRSVLLDDGSMVFLNTSTAIEVRFSDEFRQVRMLRGEALFDVQKDLGRIFLVETSDASIRVTGTQFNVYEQDGGTAVTVIEGKVEVTPRHAATSKRVDPASVTASRGGALADLAAGDQAVVRSGSVDIETRSIPNLEPVTAWTERRLVFDTTPLSEIVAEFNRYNRTRLVVDDASLLALELSGVFSSHDPETLVLFLERIADVEAITSANGSELHIRATRATP